MKRKDLIKKMQDDSVTICEYCGKQKDGLSFVIGASKTPDWTMIEGTGKITCPDCYKVAEDIGQAVIHRVTGL